MQLIVFQTPIVVQSPPINKERRQFCCHWCWGDTGSGLIRQCSFEAIITFIASGECPRPFGVIGLGEFVAERERLFAHPALALAGRFRDFLSASLRVQSLSLLGRVKPVSSCRLNHSMALRSFYTSAVNRLSDTNSCSVAPNQ